MNRIRVLLASLAVSALVALSSLPASAQAPKPAGSKPATAIATFAGGCFWCVEEVYDKVPGVIATVSGYMGGHVKNPTYEMVSTGRTGHTEVLQVEYDPAKVTYQQLLDAFWRNIDPTQANGQFCDIGSQYRSEVFYHNDEQKRLAEASKAALVKSRPFKGEIVTAITRAGEFYPAEDYHQNYHQRNPVRYRYYKTGCGREARLRELWGKPGK